MMNSAIYLVVISVNFYSKRQQDMDSQEMFMTFFYMSCQRVCAQNSTASRSVFNSWR